MLRNFLKTVLRNTLRHKGYSALNILGLAVGLACTFFIVLWVQDEMNMDQFHEDSDRIYSVMRHSTFGGTKGTTGSIPKPMAQALLDEYPDVENTVLFSWEEEILLTLDQEGSRKAARFAGKDLFKVFSFNLLAGSAETALEVPESVVISESMAIAFFGEDWQQRDDVLGTMFRLENRIDVTLTGVFEDTPSNSSIQFDFVVPIEEFIRRNEWVESWSNNGLRMFARLHPGVDLDEFNAKIKDMIDARVDAYESDAFFYPFKDIYLKSDFDNGVLVGGRIDYVRMFGLVALLIIVIASINFMNLSTARSSQRSREIGVRKSIGASRSSIAWQFMGEALFKSFVALFVAFLIVIVLMPAFNELTGKSVSLFGQGVGIWLLFTGIALLTGLLSGSYPAVYLSGFSVAGAFQKKNTVSGKGSGLRKGLVVLQFGMSIMLIVGTFTIYKQLEFIRNKDLGIQRENVVMMELEGGIEQQYDAFKSQLLASNHFVNISTASNNPLYIGNDTIGVTWDGKDPDDNTLFWNSAVGHDFVETMGIPLADGRSFSREYGADTSNYLVNWKAAEAMGMANPVGQQITFWDRPGTIVGVMEDFHMSSMYQPIRPVIFRLRPDDTWLVFLRIASGKTKEALAELEQLYKTFNPEYPFAYSFLDEEFEQAYRNEVILGKLANVFAFVAIFIACLGLFGLASYTAEQRTKEIGIRKVMGASVGNVVYLLSRQFLALVAVAFLLAAPIAFIVMNRWLDDFEYHTELGAGLLVVAGIGTLVIAWLTVSYQSIRSALANPADSLRTE